MTSDLDFLISMNDAKPTEPPPSSISEYVHQRRVIPPGEPREGILDVNYAPHLIEPMDCMGPYSGVRITTIMKSVQAGVTFNCAENVAAYYMDANPKQILYCTATLSLLEKWTKRLEPLITSCGFRHKLVSAESEDLNKKARRSGDKMYSKEYIGGSLSMTSLESPAGLRSETKQIVIIDEIDGASAKTSTGEGSSVSILHGRAAAFGARGKFMEFSTPNTIENSVIYKRYLLGDQRKYYVPCPHCGTYQVLDFYNLQPEYNSEEQLDVVWYKCAEKECSERIDNWDITRMLKHGEWRATAIPKTIGHRSYHINTLYNPVGMMGWKDVYEKYLVALEDPDEMPSFTNLYLGLPYKEMGFRPDYKKVQEKSGTYKDGTVPEGVIFLTMAGDIQLGAEKYQKMTPEELDIEIEKIRTERGELALWKSKIPRIELEVYGEGLAYRSWSVDYKVFYGHTTYGAYEGAFERVHQWFEDTKLIYRRADGKRFNPKIASFDASEGKTSSTVFEFCERFGANVYPNINTDWIKKKKDREIDEESMKNFDRYAWGKKDKGGGVYLKISTNHYKKKLYTRLNLKRNDNGLTPPAFCDFPMDRSSHYFKMLTAEEQLEGGSFKRSESTPAESLDCRVYNLCIADVWLESQVKQAKERAEKSGRYAHTEINKIDKPYILNEMARNLK